MSAINGNPGANYPPVQNGKERRGGLLTKADYARLVTTAERAKLAALEAPVLRLAYTAAADILSGAALAATTWTNAIADQSFSVNSATSYLIVEVRAAILGNGAAITQYATRALMDGASPVPLAGAAHAAGGYAVASGAAFQANGLAAGAHTIRVQVYATAATTVYCRAASFPSQEWLAIRVWELST